MSVSALGDIIRWPFLMMGKILHFILDYFISIAIVAGSIYLVYWLFSSGFIKRLAEAIKKRREVIKDDGTEDIGQD